MLGSKKMLDLEFTVALFTKAMERGIFIKAGHTPEPNSFLSMVVELNLKYSVLKNWSILKQENSLRL